MKLNYRDKIIAAILIAITILLIGYFALIKPKYKDIQTHQKNLKEVQKTQDEIKAQIAEIPDLKNAILKLYEDTSVITAKFVPIADVQNQIYIDKYMQKFADDCKVKLLSVELKEAKLTPIEYYYNTVSDNFGDMRKAADVDGSLAKQYAEQTAESKAVSQRAKESIMQTQYGISIHGTQKCVWAYLEALKNFDKTLTVDSVTMGDGSFGKNEAEALNVSLPDSKEADEETTVDAGENKKISNATDVRIVVTLYSVYEMAKPNVEDVSSN